MKVKEIMTATVRSCDLNESLAEVAKTMWDNDCGILPVRKDGQDVVGVITDRDVCMGAAMRDAHPSSISVEEVITGNLYSVAPEDDVSSALELMRGHRVRRLPVIDAEGELKGILSMNDIVLNAKETNAKKGNGLSYGDVVRTFQAICEHPKQSAAAAAGN